MRFSYVLAFLCIPWIVGCDGCSNSNQDVDPANESEADFSDFSPGKALSFPADEKPNSGGVKPGHWTTASLSLKSNKTDTRGELQSQASMRLVQDRDAVTTTTDFGVRSRRPIVLPKGQMRRFDYRLLTPSVGAGNQRNLSIGNRFVASGRGTFFDTGRKPYNVLARSEYFFVILTSRPQRFAEIQVADWVRPIHSDMEIATSVPNYKIVFPSIKDVLPLSETMLDWTSTAVVLWDDADPNTLTPNQQRAMSDWLRFGGQLIINGATASDALAKTMLADTMPLKPTGNIELNPESAEELLVGWSVKDDPSTKKQIALAQEQGGVAVDGTLNEGAQDLPDTGKLILQRMVGRGRVVQARIDLVSDWIKSWESYNGFFNSVILLRPHRKFKEPTRNQYDTYADVSQVYVDFPLARDDATMNTRFRIATRDAKLPAEIGKPTSRKQIVASRSRLDTLTNVHPVSGISGWTDNSDALNMCSDILRAESGIEIPASSLVVKALSWYLLILVPINYLIFRIMGRLEYAWLAVPAIALGGAFLVARAARLDIGFARSQTQIGILELPPDYQRAHLTSLVGIYNSLSSEYEIQFKTIDGAAAASGTYSSDENTDRLTFNSSFGEGPSLSGIAVDSNKNRLVHTEEIIDVGGGIRLDGDSLVNQSDLEIMETFVIRKDENGDSMIAAVGLCEPNSKTKLFFKNVPELAINEDLPMQMRTVILRFGSTGAMPHGSTRLVGRIDGSISNATITPLATQTKAQTVVLAHLRHPDFVNPQKDTNLLSQYVKKQKEQIDKEFDEANDEATN